MDGYWEEKEKGRKRKERRNKERRKGERLQRRTQDLDFNQLNVLLNTVVSELKNMYLLLLHENIKKQDYLLQYFAAHTSD